MAWPDSRLGVRVCVFSAGGLDGLSRRNTASILPSLSMSTWKCLGL